MRQSLLSILLILSFLGFSQTEPVYLGNARIDQSDSLKRRAICDECIGYAGGATKLLIDLMDLIQSDTSFRDEPFRMIAVFRVSTVGKAIVEQVSPFDESPPDQESATAVLIRKNMERLEFLPANSLVLFALGLSNRVEETFTVVEDPAEFPGGLKGFYSYLGKNIKYPRAARKAGIQGKVYVQFIIEKDGSVSNLSVIKGIGGGCDEEAVRVLTGMPKWKPGKQDGEAIRQRLVQPINFKFRGSRKGRNN